MTTNRDEYLERAKYCVKLAESEGDPLLRAFLERLASQWNQVANNTPSTSENGTDGSPSSKAKSPVA